MKTNKQTVKLTRTINAPPQEVFDSFQHECRLREWMCDGARTQPRKGGLFEVRWNSGYEARGIFTSFSPPRTLAFTWSSPYEPDETNIRIALKPVEGGTKITLTHTGFGTGKKWAGRAEEAEREWNGGLDNLKSTLETGIDLRHANQPRIGIGFETAEGRSGVVLTAILSGAPANLAGLQKDDVIVRMNGRKVRDEQDFISIFQSCHVGQRVPIAYLREGKRHTTTVELAARPTLDVPDDPAVLVEQARQIHDKALAALRTSAMMLTDEQAGTSPAEGEWSVKQVLAHLSASERGFQQWAVNVLLGNETYGIVGHLSEQFAAVFATAPTVGALLDRFERDMAESRAIIAALTPERRALKVRYRSIAQTLLNFGFHTDDHLKQIQATVRAVVGK